MRKVKIAKRLEKVFSAEVISSLNEESGFIERHRNLDASSFFHFLTLDIAWSGRGYTSLREMCGLLDVNYDISLTKQSLSSQFNDRSVKFMELALNKLLLTPVHDIDLEDFNINRLLIADSTGYQISDKLSDAYPGCGGGGSPAGVKVYSLISYLNGCFLHLEPTEGKRNDARFNEITRFKKGDLILQDMGFSYPAFLDEIAGIEAYFISRLSCSIKLYYQGNRYSLLELSQLLFPTSLSHKRRSVMVSFKQDGPSFRLNLKALSKGKHKQRVREERKKCRKKGIKKSPAYYALLAYTIHLTNLSAKQLADDKVAVVYSLRWQIEIEYKAWKSILDIVCQQDMAEERFKTLLWAYLIVITLQRQIITAIKNYLWNKKKIELSDSKTYDNIKAYTADLYQAIVKKKQKVIQVIEKMFLKLIHKNNYKEKRKGNKYHENVKYAYTPYEILSFLSLN